MKTEDKKEAALAAAKEYVDRQLAIMEQHGSAPKLSQTVKKELVKQVARTTLRFA
jgi:hypothetical protein